MRIVIETIDDSLDGSSGEAAGEAAGEAPPRTLVVELARSAEEPWASGLLADTALRHAIARGFQSRQDELAGWHAVVTPALLSDQADWSFDADPTLSSGMNLTIQLPAYLADDFSIATPETVELRLPAAAIDGRRSNAPSFVIRASPAHTVDLEVRLDPSAARGAPHRARPTLSTCT